MHRLPHSSVARVFVFTALLLFQCGRDAKPIDATEISVVWAMGENSFEGKSQFKSSFRIVSSADVSPKGWSMYFNFPRTINSSSVTGNVTIENINGDFYALRPKPEFSLEAGDTLTVEFVSSDWAINKSDAPAGLYIVPEDEQGREKTPVIIEDYSIADFSDKNQTSRSSGDLEPVADADELFQKYSDRYVDPANKVAIVPTPVAFTAGDGTLNLSSNFVIKAPTSLSGERDLLDGWLKDLLSPAQPGIPTTITLSVDELTWRDGRKLAEAYVLSVTKFGITITGTDPAGVLYGIQSLRSLIPVASLGKQSLSIAVPYVEVIDFPRFSYRGIHLDVARNFQSKETVLKMLDLMSMYKLNKLHFHLSDDEGWRVEIKSLPELTEVGGQRSHDRTGKGMVPSFGSGPRPSDQSSGSGFYSSDDFIEILKYADTRKIEIIPKVDVPGHARAAIKSMDARYTRLLADGKRDEAMRHVLRDTADQSVYRSVQNWNDNVVCVCQESTYGFLETVVDDLAAMYKQAGVPFNTFHIGADEVPHGVWENSPRCKELMAKENLTIDKLPEYFFRRTSAILKNKNLRMGGWEEIALRKVKKGNEVQLEANPEFVNANFQPYVWNSVWGWGQEDVGYKLANAGYKVVLGNVTNLYFDLAYEKHPDEPGYYWGAFVDTRKVFEFNPFDIYLDPGKDRMGNAVDQNSFSKKVALSPNARMNILGIQGQLWAENLKGPAALEYMAFPKLLALAERAWTPQPAWTSEGTSYERSDRLRVAWNNFANAVGNRELPRLDKLHGGVRYRISPPGAAFDGGMLYVLTEFPNTIVRYTLDGTEPTATSPQYLDAIQVKDGVTVKLKAFDTTGRGSRTVETRHDPPIDRSSF